MDSLRNKRVLDAGCGAGRTTPFLHNLAKSYLGFDYSSKMIEIAKQRYQSIDLRVLNAKNLDTLEDGSFDFVLFSHNGIDYVPHNDRLTILQELHKKMAPRALLAFSTHNLAHYKTLKHKAPRLGLSLHPGRLIAKISDWMEKRRNYRKIQAQQIWTNDYAQVVDGGMKYSLLTYYIEMHMQIKQLNDCGFEVISMYDTVGRIIKKETITEHIPWIHYVVRKCEE